MMSFQTTISEFKRQLNLASSSPSEVLEGNLALKSRDFFLYCICGWTKKN